MHSKENKFGVNFKIKATRNVLYENETQYKIICYCPEDINIELDICSTNYNEKNIYNTNINIDIIY